MGLAPLTSRVKMAQAVAGIRLLQSQRDPGAVVGRPNAGKSSYINRLLQTERLIVSDIPGTTVDCIDVPFTIKSESGERHYVLTDTAGMRAPRKTSGSIEHFSGLRTENTIRNADVVVLLIDAFTGPVEQDKKIANLILEYNKGCVILLNKWDLVEKLTEREYLERDPEKPAHYRYLA